MATCTRKGLYEDIDNWKKFDETTIPPKEAFYSNVNLEGISNTDYAHAQKVWEVFEIKDHGEYHDLCSQSDTLLLVDVLKNFRYMCLDEYRLDPAHFDCSRISMASLLKKAGVKLELLASYDMLLMIKKGIRGGICQATHRYAKTNNKYMKNYAKTLIHHI